MANQMICFYIHEQYHKSTGVIYLISPQLIVSILRDIADPRQRLVSRLLDNLQVSHLDSRCGEVGDLEPDLNGRLPVLDVALDAGEGEVGAHEILLPAGKGLDVPHDGALLRGVLAVADARLELGCRGVWMAIRKILA